MGFKPHQLVSAERKKSSAPLGSPVRRKLHSREPKRCLPRVRSLNPGSSRIKLLPIQRPYSSINFLGSVLVISYTSGDSRQFRTFKRKRAQVARDSTSLYFLVLWHFFQNLASFSIFKPFFIFFGFLTSIFSNFWFLLALIIWKVSNFLMIKPIWIGANLLSIHV